MKQLQCLRCLHKWYPRSPKKPIMCPKCKTLYWETERKNANSKRSKKII